MAKNKAHGGARDGAGRKRIYKETALDVFGLRIPPNIVNEFKEGAKAAGKSNRDYFIELIRGNTSKEQGPQMQKALEQMMSLKGCSEEEALEVIASIALSKLALTKTL